MRKLRPYLLLQAASLASFIAGSATFIATPWLALEVSKSSTVSAIIIAITAIPALVLTPFVGGLIDRFGRRRMAIVLELITFFTTAAIPIAAVTIGINVQTLILFATIKTIFQPGTVTARKSLLPDVCDASGLSLDRANSIGEAISAAGFAIGPAIAALCIGTYGINSAYWAAASCSAIAGIIAIFIRVTEKQEVVESDADAKNPFKFALQGFVALKKLPSLLIVFLSFTILSVIYMPTEMVVLPRYYNGIDFPQGLGFLITTMSIFTVIGSLMYEFLHKWLGFANVVRIAGIGIGVVMIPMSLGPDYWVMLLLGVVVGFVWGPMMPLLNTLIQTMVPANIRGRVFAIETVMWNTAPLTSYIVVGICLDAFGVQPVYTTLAVLVLLASIAVAVAPQLKDLKKVKSS
jgi:MFS family permease